MVEKKCKNCEHYQASRRIKTFLSNVSVDCVNNKTNICLKRNRNISSGGCSCNCGGFTVWSSLRIALDNKKTEVTKNDNNSLKDYIASPNKYIKAKKHYKTPTDNSSFLTGKNNQLKRKASIVFIVLSSLSLSSSIFCIIFAAIIKSIYKNEQNSTAIQLVKNAKDTNTFGIILLIISVVVLFISIFSLRSAKRNMKDEKIK